jgi:flagellar biosynthetic protein FliQ
VTAGPGLELVIRAAREGLWLVLLLSAPALVASVAVGVFVGVVQAATQVQDQALAFVPKLVVVLLVLAATGPLLGAELVRFLSALLAAIPTVR